MNGNMMSKNLDAAKAAFDADLAGTNGRMNESEIKAVFDTLTDPMDKKAFIQHMMNKAATLVGAPSINYAAITEFLEAVRELPSGEALTREKFEELAVDLSPEDRIYVAKMLIEEQERRNQTRYNEIREQVRASNPLDVPGVRISAIREYTNKLSNIIMKNGSPTRQEHEELLLGLNQKERDILHSLQMKVSGGTPLTFRDGGSIAD